MAKIKYDVSGVDHKKAANLGNFEVVKPGTYRAKIVEANPGFSKGEDGKPDKAKPRVEIVFNIIDKPYKGAPQWYYLTYGDNEFVKQKMSQFLQAVGIRVDKKAKGQFDTDDVIGETVKIKVRNRKDSTPDDPRTEVSAVFPSDDPDDDEDDEDLEDDDDIEEDDDDDEDEDEDDEEEEEEEDDEEEEVADYSEWSVKELRQECEDRELSTKGGKPALIKRLEENDEESSDDEDEDEDDEDPF